MSDVAISLARPIIGDEELAAVERVLRSGVLVQGPEVAEFEREFSRTLVSDQPCVAVNSGTAGLHLGLMAAGIGPGDEVVVPSFTFAATANAVALTGATPVFADIDHDSFCLSPQAVEAAITPRTAAIMPVHLYGHPAAMTRLSEIADRHGLALFEDAAQAHGAALHGRPVGTWGAFAMFSLYPTKNMTAGEGGMDSCATEGLARQIRLLRNQGMERLYENEIIGFNCRMTDLNAAIGRVQLAKLAGWTAQRQANARFLDEHLDGVKVPPVAPGVSHVYHQYTIRVSDGRDRFVQALAEEHKVASRVYYPTPVHRLASFGRTLDLPETELAVREVISLPVHPALSPEDLEAIAHAVNSVAKAAS